jgi:hypothetical protein
MKTVLITNGNLASLLGIGDFLRQHGEHVEAVFITTRLPSQKSNVAGVMSMFRNSGYAYAHFKLLTNLLLPFRLRRKGLPVSVPEFLRHLGSPAQVFETPDINSPASLERVQSFAPEIIISFSATTRFSDPIIDSASRAAINAHYALLPGYAGLSPYFWYLRNQEEECGTTLHQIISRLDAGPIIDQACFKLEGHATVLSVMLEQTSHVSPMLSRFYRGETSEHHAQPQDLSQRSYFRHPRRSDVAALFEHGHRFYDESDLSAIERRLREIVAQESLAA